MSQSRPPASEGGRGPGPVTLLPALYVTQFLGVGFLSIGLTGILREEGTSLQDLGLVSLLGLIWAFKFLWAPVVDRFGWRRLGHYRSWLIPLQLGLVLTMLLLIPYRQPAAELGAVLVIVAVYVLFSATQDIAADALAVRLLDGKERDRINGVQVAASYLGNILGGGLALIIYDRFGWAAALLTIAGLTALALVLVLAFREPVRAPEPAGRTVRLGSMFGVLSQPGAKRWVLAAVPLVYVGSALGWAITTPAMIDAGWALSEVGIVTGMIASVPAVLAGVGAGFVISRFGRARIFLFGASLLAAATLGLLPVASGQASPVVTAVAIAVHAAAYTVCNVVIYIRMMDYARPASAGTDFTVQTSIGLGASFIAGWLALTLAATFGYPAVLVLALLVLACGVGVALVDLRVRRSGAPTPPT